VRKIRLVGTESSTINALGDDGNISLILSDNKTASDDTGNNSLVIFEGMDK
jgi:hypothetical protein